MTEYIKGYNWAVGSVLREDNARNIQRVIDTSKTLGVFTEFERGAEAGLARIEELLEIEWNYTGVEKL